jgi:ubiquitin-conjugating enzyme E2 variant
MTLPAVRESRSAERWVFAAGIGVAYVLVALIVARLAMRLSFPEWWIPIAVVAGVAAADLVSGLVHWAADTWGRDDMPLIGPRVLVPFRVHHINPDDFLRRRFVDVNGDVALLAVPALLGLLTMRIETTDERAWVVFGVAFSVATMLTNQIHQWAHMPSPPRVVRVLQSWRLVLGPLEHASHHNRPYDVRYCITTGWWNPVLEAAGFFRLLESVVTRLTRAQARGDDRLYERRYMPSGRADG